MASPIFPKRRTNRFGHFRRETIRRPILSEQTWCSECRVSWRSRYLPGYGSHSSLFASILSRSESTIRTKSSDLQFPTEHRRWSGWPAVRGSKLVSHVRNSKFETNSCRSSSKDFWREIAINGVKFRWIAPCLRFFYDSWTLLIVHSVRIEGVYYRPSTNKLESKIPIRSRGKHWERKRSHRKERLEMPPFRLVIERNPICTEQKLCSEFIWPRSRRKNAHRSSFASTISWRSIAKIETFGRESIYRPSQRRLEVSSNLSAVYNKEHFPCHWFALCDIWRRWSSIQADYLCEDRSCSCANGCKSAGDEATGAKSFTMDCNWSS